MVLAIFTSITKKMEENKLEWVFCIWYPIIFKDQTKTLLDLGSKVNAISQAFTHQLDFKIQKTNVEAQKIEGTTLEIYRIIVSTFSMSDKDDKEKFFEESFLLADVKPDIVLGMHFLIMSNIDIDFKLGTYNESFTSLKTCFQPPDESS